MVREGESTGPSPRTWTVFFGVAWGLLGVWSISAGQTWLGVGQLTLAGMHVLTLVSERFAAIMDAPLFRRKRAHDAH